MFRIETQSAVVGPSSLGPSLEIENEAHARAVADGLRSSGLEVELFQRDGDNDPWRRIHLEALLPIGAQTRGDRMFDEYVVIVRRPGGDYELATTTIFLTRSLADEYARAALPAREAMVVGGRFSQLKFD